MALVSLFLLKLAEPLFLSSLPPLPTPFSPPLSSPEPGLCSLLHVGLADKDPLTMLPLVKYLQPVMNTSIPAGGEQWKEQMEFSSVAGTADNQVQN